MSFPKPAFWLGSFSIVAGCSALAQQSPPAARPAPQLEVPYRSALEGYRPFADEKVAPWTASNEAVRSAGGWRAYAREAQEGAGQSAPPATPAAPAASATQPGHKH